MPKNSIEPTSEISDTIKTTKVIHVTDLFRPSVDDDDHFDLAFEYALAYTGKIELAGIVLDRSTSRNPDVLSVAQLNYISGLSIPLSVGIYGWLDKKGEISINNNIARNNGVRMILNLLEESEQAVVIHITGTCRDVAVAGILEPELFKKKCKGIYLNMGVSTNDTIKQRSLDYNVNTDRLAYQLIWKIPCPIYWMPVHDRWEPDWNVRKDIKISQNSTFYRLSQNEILPFLSEKMKRYYMFMFDKEETSNWLRYIEKSEIDSARFNSICERTDEKWCTAGFIHAAGKSVSVNGELIDDMENGVFCFRPVRVTCDKLSRTTWQFDEKATNRFIFHINDMDNYQMAMQKVIKNLFKTLP